MKFYFTFPLTLVFLFLLWPTLQAVPVNEKPAGHEIPMEDTVLHAPWYPVFEFSDKVWGVVFPVKDWGVPNSLDSLANQIAAQDSFYVDDPGSEGGFRVGKRFTPICKFKYTWICKNQNLSLALKDQIGRKFSVLGTSGTADFVVTGVAVSYNYCISNFIILELAQENKKSLGHPLFAADASFENCSLRTDPKISKWVAAFADERRRNGEYVNAIPYQVAAACDHFYFVFSDDFTWNDGKDEGACRFPGRLVFIADEKGNLALSWEKGLDLFGIPCD